MKKNNDQTLCWFKQIKNLEFNEFIFNKKVINDKWIYIIKPKKKDESQKKRKPNE